jgi:probable rRNA maturation factor
MNPQSYFFTEGISFQLKQKTKIRKWVKDVIINEKQHGGVINFIFCSDSFLLNLNQTYLHHNTLTDILTFPETQNPLQVSGDIYISIQRVEENAGKYNEVFEKELFRVMIHGVLHLLGYKDNTKKEKEAMRLREDHYLTYIA